MKKLISALFAILLLFSISSAEDYSKMTNDELQIIQDSVRNELLKRRLLSEEKITLLDSDGISVYFTGECEINVLKHLSLKVIIINDTDREFSILTDISVNGWDVHSNSASLEAHPHKKSKGDIDITIKDADISTIEEIEDVLIRLTYWFDDDNMDHKKIDPITIQFPLK